MNTEEKILIAFAPDDKQMKLALVSMISILENTKRNIEFVILYSKLSTKSLDMLRSLKKYKNCSINYLRINLRDFDNFPISSWVTVQTWFRIKIADLYPNADKVIYLDCDTLSNADIEQLWNIDITNNLVGVVEDVYGSKNKVETLKLENPSYFNAGVLLINCKKWRECNLFEKLKAYAIENFKTLKASDQDALNKIIDKDKINLPQKFNYLEVWWLNNYHEYKNENLKTYEEARKNPNIIHFTAYKPNTVKSQHSYKDLWWKYAKKSIIYEELLEDYKKQADDLMQKVKTDQATLKKNIEETEKIMSNMKKLPTMRV